MKIYPPRGKVLEIDFGSEGPMGPFAADLTFPAQGNVLSFLVTRGSLLNRADDCTYRAVPVADNIWMVSWRESDGLTVVQVQDFSRMTVLSAVTGTDSSLNYMDGTIRMREVS